MENRAIWSPGRVSEGDIVAVERQVEDDLRVAKGRQGWPGIA
jgi:hypothetical protein